MTAEEFPGPAAVFCRLLGRLVHEQGIQQRDVARAVNLSPATISMLLSGKRRTPPPWEDVARIVEYCQGRGDTSVPGGLTTDTDWWRHRHHEAQTHHDQTPLRPRVVKASAPRRAENIPDDFVSAVDVLVGGRTDEFHGLAEQLLQPLSLQGEVAADLRGVLEGFAERVRASHGTTRTALLCAADLAILVTAFCDAVGASGIRYDAELAYEQGDLVTDVVTELERITLGSHRVRHPADVRAEIESVYRYAADTVHDTGDWQAQIPDELALHAWRRYEALLAPVTWDCPELRLTSDTEDPPEALDPSEIPATASPSGRGMAGLSRLFSEFTSDDSTMPPRRMQHLRAPLAPSEESGPRIPSLQAGYINPSFRVAGRFGPQALVRDDWWQTQPLWQDLETFLAAHLLTAHATRAPLLILGHPGSGKSLLTKLITARLPEAEFFCHRVELRHLPADLDVQEQLEESLRRSTGQRALWPEATDQATGVVRVVLLDGFDELLQAAADHMDPARHFNYLENVSRLQQREADHGRPVVVIVTSRTVVADHARIPRLSTVIRLEPFDDERIRTWLDVWNSTNRRYFFTTHNLQPLTWDVVSRHRDLASQPLLLLMLALYDATSNALRQRDGIERLTLYERLLTEFVRRQVTKQHDALPADTEAAQVEHELQRLAVIAIGMFNRHRQGITATDAENDLAALLRAAPNDATPLLFGRFFFIHEAQAVLTGHEHHSYEFLHATFGEYLLTRLITDELHRLQAITSPGSDRPVDDGRLYALLSHAPLTDRAEVVRNTSDHLTRLTETQRAHLTTVLRTLFHQTPGDTSHRTSVPYHPAPVHRTQQDAVYSANLLLLAVLTHSGIRVSSLLGTRNTVDQWRRHTQLWRSQLSDGSWDAFTRTLTSEPLTGPANQTMDLQVSESSHLPQQELAWTVSFPHPEDTATETFRHPEDAPADLYRPATFMYDVGTQHLLHAMAPLLHQIPAAAQTYQAADDQHSRSLAHLLVSLLPRPATSTWPSGMPYPQLLRMLQALPMDARLLAADILARHLLHAATDLPAATVIDTLDQLTTPQFTSSGGLTAKTWLVLADCVNSLASRSDIPHDQLGRITRRFGPQAPALDTGGDPLTRLSLLLAEAQSTLMWHAAGRRQGQTALDEALTLLEQLPQPRPPHAVIGLLRLARDLGADNWLTNHAEPLLATLTHEGLQHLRPTDVDGLQDHVHDEALQSELRRITSCWR
ncbi:helix-turn-helix domain-containing protein [Streptomyces sp. NPDC051572]|uniref:NACHT N-terminal helical domain 7-containing protein n=1 Tax=Streptomyces sp. NPDC051572 TaxID=3155802 RepID=UPI0034504746